MIESTSELGLSDHHQNNLVQYLKFCRLQRQSRINMVLTHFEDTLKRKLLDETYTREEVTKILNDLKDVTRSELESELINVSHMNLLLFRQLSAQAEKHHINLFINLYELEDRQLLDAVRVFESEHFERKTSKTATILQKLIALEGTVEGRTRRESVEAAKMRQELELCEKEMKELVEAGENERKQRQKLTDELQSYQQRLLQTKKQLELKENELEKKFEQTNTYKTMKHMMQQKNKIIKELREMIRKNGLVADEDEDDGQFGS